MTAALGGPALKVSEIFVSLQGESSRVGLPTVFVRLTGCPLRCTWCDTAYAFQGGKSMALPELLAVVASHGVRHVCVTGGEPLAQHSCLSLLRALGDAGHSVSLETSGALDIAGVDRRVSRIVDLKAPGSGESARNRWQNLDLLTARDELKFVLRDRLDYEWARSQVVERGLADICPLLFSPVAAELPPATLAGWIVEDRLPVRFQVQLHKILWGDERGR
ncbi:MAG: 7-carboxy-7-deazaguanine synthase [Candidatus Accumulibacter sp. BA-94]|uniref:7-carboxy-7-deazaguanine synthase QueE n=1 Tax=Accumulibacter sp. TaxID=2053492 RepID=UPI000448F6CF|nr:7-carboxy-7-deazaguanine synthase QueE [Accumulibacter sp.]EXI92363.1 MAG: 7-carboxy-7-deazaguanine synthase [Candidatus Accumulibacter sp. BA-94]MBL8393008.1 7-carboxy-7-deazaguanine synthase QueE [Accumulibacter sp.]HRD87406.1 7-carboxy-7-deazaguanine synthase QueE [Accumulibacter sp.]